ncbi:MAG: prolyl oligopeptidase family serine peptidase [Chthonomonas sp.]|nr:prolyl oligopeptidase family serine peptidase [Chthonomonas sp.]
MSIPIVALAVLAHGVVGAGSPWKAGRTTESWADRSYIVKLPKAVEKPDAKLPLVMLLHGFSGSAEAIEAYSGFGGMNDTEGFILVAPQGLGRPAGWNCGFINLGKAGTDDVSFLSKLMDKVSADLPVDPSRIYVAGHSNGAMMANVLGGLRPDKIAAIACVAGVIGVGKTNPKLMAEPKGPVSVLHIHGTNDQIVGYSTSAAALLSGVGAKDAVKWWASQTGIESKGVEEKLKGYDSLTYSNGSTTVKLLSLTGWSHDWPVSQRSPINGAKTIWDFFKANPKRPAVIDPKLPPIPATPVAAPR